MCIKTFNTSSTLTNKAQHCQEYKFKQRLQIKGNLLYSKVELNSVSTGKKIGCGFNIIPLLSMTEI